MPIPAVSFRSPTFQRHYGDQVRSIYRALLRESTYLPDDQARRWVRSQIASRFKSRANLAIKNLTLIHAAPNRRAAHEAFLSLKDGLRKSRAALSVLQRATNGDLASLTKVLMNAYGRTGRRRHELLADLLRVETPGQGEDGLMEVIARAHLPGASSIASIPVPAILDHPAVDVSKDLITCRIKREYVRLTALVESQVSHDTDGRGALTKMRQTHFQMPARNIWHRQMPRKRVINAAKAWTRNFLGRVLPPLPEQEWQRLNNIVHGKLACETSRPRRAPTSSKPEELSPFDLERLLLAEDDYSAGTYHNVNGIANERIAFSSSGSDSPSGSTPAKDSIVQHPDHWLDNRSNIEAAFTEVMENTMQLNQRRSKSLPERSKEAGSQVDSRLMRRILANVLLQCPKLDKADNGTWVVKWGQRIASRPLVATSLGFAPLFVAKEAPREKRLELKSS